jgi:hypothetical protein
MAVAGILISAVPPSYAWGQQVTVTGMVVERTQSSWIGGATVRLSGSPSFFTDLDGAFQFTRVTPGRHTLTVEALGYQSRSVELEIRADTILLVEMDPDPILLDSLLVRAGSITIRGRILDAETGQGVLYAQVAVEPGLSTTGALSGSFTLRGVPRGRAVTVLVQAVEYMPARIALITDADTTLTIELDPDPVGIRIVAEQVKKLHTRSNSIPFPRSVIDREDLIQYRGGTAYEITEARLRTVRYSRNPLGLTRGGTTPQCIFIDDVQQLDLGLFWSISAGELERIEIFDRGGMIRAYTKRYVVSLLGRPAPPILYMKIGLNRVCR